jgi:hypothetical protein
LPIRGAIGESADLRDALAAIEFFLPEVLREVHAEWQEESLDGIYPAFIQKTGDDEIEIIGLCILISDQTLTPIHLRLQLAPTDNTVSWLECNLGEATDTGMLRVPYSRQIVYGDKLGVLKRLDSIRWVYKVGYGERRPGSGR